jgi:NAD(P)-dependent dehydrogenase (short-subunit alcohol dehydrogenase family)
MRLDHQVALVTGASSGIGKAVAFALAGAGARVVVSDIDAAHGGDVVTELRRSGADALFVECDVSDPEACARLVDAALRQYGRLDVACNNAGISGPTEPTAGYPVDAWQRVIAVNLSGVFYCMRAELAAMVEAGRGAIVNMASILAQVGFATAPANVAAKHGVVGLTRTAAVEYAQAGVRVNAVGPAFISTPMIAALEQRPDALQALVAAHPIGRLGRPEEVAALVLWLSTDAASFVTGAYYPVDGGYLAR